MNHQSAILYILERLANELPDSLHYHSLAHTIQVMEAAHSIAVAEGVTGGNLSILATAAAYHDCGFLRTYAQHEEASCDIAGEFLPGFGFESDSIKIIQDMIMSTRVPQVSETHLGRILCDADLDYLGGDNYDEIAQGLLSELQLNGFEIDEEKWLEVQIDFLDKHQFWTQHSKRLHSDKKQLVINRLRLAKENYDLSA